jgi:hypothetical protein
MNISACGCGNAAQSLQSNLRAAFHQKLEDFKTLAKAIDSGDTSGAQTALDTVTKNLQNDPRIAKSGQSEKINQDLAALGEALKSGNADDAKKAFATLAQDLKALHPGGHHHHHRVDNDGDGDDAAASSGTGATDSATAAVGNTLNAVA